MGGMADPDDGKNEDKSYKNSWICEGQISAVGKRYRDISSAMVGNCAYRAIVVVVLLVVVMMESDQQNRVQHYHRHCEGDEIPETFM